MEFMKTGKIEIVLFDDADGHGNRSVISIDPSKSLTMYAVYKNPDDYPGKYVVRRCYAGGDVPAGKVGMDVICDVSDDYDMAMSFIPDGCVRIDRSPNDVPCVMETWM